MIKEERVMQVKTMLQSCMMSLLPFMVAHAGKCVQEQHASAFFGISSLSINNACQAVAGWSSNSAAFVNNFDGNMWGDTPIQLDTLIAQRVIKVCINNSGNALAIWSTFIKGIRTANFDGNNWSTEISLPSTDGIDPFSFCLDDNGNAIIVWEVGRMITTRESANLGVDWSDDDVLGETTCNTICSPVFSMSCKGNAVAMWIDQGGIKAAIFDGNMWQKPGANFVAPPEDGKVYSEGAIAVSINDNGNAAAAWIVEDQGTAQVQGAFYNGASWELTNFTSLINLPSRFVSLITPTPPSVSLNNNDRALVGWLIFPSIKPASDLANVLASVQFINGKWEGIDSFPTTRGGQRRLLVCNNTAGDGVAASSVTGSIVGEDQNIETITFVGDTSKWSSISTHFQGILNELHCAKLSSSGASAGIIGLPSDTFLAEAGVASVLCCNTQFPLTASSPTSLEGTCCLNRFAMQGEFFRKFTWTISPDSDIVSQNIYRDDVLIANIPPTQTTFEDHNRPSIQAKYGVSAVNAAGGISVPAEVTPIC